MSSVSYHVFNVFSINNLLVNLTTFIYFLIFIFKKSRWQAFFYITCPVSMGSEPAQRTNKQGKVAYEI